MPNLALVTGASAGIGREFARLHAARGGDLVITARREQELQALKAELESGHGVSVHVFAHDLAGHAEARALYEKVTSAALTPDILINNAGFGGGGKHLARDLATEMAMIDLNVKALVTLSWLVARDMVTRGSGRILNVGSTAGFVPGPGQAVYFATKAFVNSYSQALAQELKGTGVTVTALAPGYVETEFADVADLRDTQMVKQGGASPRSVAKHGYDAMMKGKLITINEKKLSILLKRIIPFVPRKTLLKMVAAGQKKRG
ncbi:SDR family NAD(P)-dependent oxidoreductase [Sphingomicrobium astaxanthinifaciens]|uniref:SDR family NAD(P)-dependent oxidoreductase n=1 Tax=Sphingomicrobium astaxanthinifaciens TaxID=1227949 RepID=UPI001FCB04AF|nr:SDR family oxidoreductase [Sphingomicrobium astaxanthinifaciens]MCJ7420476.1 SDR family oxidoreductase [Sphingomicrobium astaxanthinifaciens]